MEGKGVLVRGEERSGFDEGKGKGPGKAPKQIRVPPLTDRKFVEGRPRDSASRLSRGATGCPSDRSTTRSIVSSF